jgi:hypothetical protein
MSNIAVVTSTSFGSNNAACFNQGLLSSLGTLPTILGPFPGNGSYSNAFLRGLIRTAVNNSPRPDLIVAAGGLVMAQAAAQELGPSDPKFVYLSGDALSGSPIASAGGVNMNNPGEDKVRKEMLTDPPFNVDPGKLYLIVNSHAPMSRSDGQNWPPSKIAYFFNGLPNNPPGDPTAALTTEFTNLSGSNPAPAGLVISADPYFRLWRTAFTAVLGNIVPVPVCYPFKDYLDAINNQPTKPNIANSQALELPRLNNSANNNDPNTAYFQLGRQAGRFLNGTADVKVVKWDAVAAQWLPPS